MARTLLCLLVAMLALACEPARAEQVVATLSSQRVDIRSNFVGTDLVLFGSIERDAATVGRASGYDVVIVVRGPSNRIVAWRKERVAGIWVNSEGVEFRDAPSYYAVLSNRPLDDISGSVQLKRNAIGFDNVRLDPVDVESAEQGAEFRRALIDTRLRQHLFVENGEAVRMLTPRLFQATIPLPANIRTGGYLTQVHVFGDGALLATTRLGFWVVKSGFEARVYELADREPLLYGLLTVAMAFGVGWLGSVMFRRD